MLSVLELVMMVFCAKFKKAHWPSGQTQEFKNRLKMVKFRLQGIPREGGDVVQIDE